MTRVIAGRHRGRRLRVPAGETTRPTADRAREGLFSSLQSLVGLDGARVLDLYAGSGAVGIEALSRGAAWATFVEHEGPACEVIRSNLASLGEFACDVVTADVERFLGGEPASFDMMFLDPPYRSDVEGVLRAAVPWLTEGGVVVVERASRDPALTWPEGLTGDRSRRYGEATLWYGFRS